VNCRRRRGSRAVACACIVGVVACADRTRAVGHDLVARVDTVGDTIVVRNERGSVWGGVVPLEPVLRIGAIEGSDEYVFGQITGVALSATGQIYVLDRQVPVVRVYDRSGRHLRSFGRRGGGPGEIQQPTGLALMPDGRVLISDPGNARVNVYSADGEPLDSWRMAGGFFSSDQVRATADGRAYVVALLSEHGSDNMITGLVRVGPDETPVDTMPPPPWDYEPARLVATFVSGDNRSMSVANVPFSPQTSWSLHPDGHLIGALSTRYAVEAFQADGRILRMERAAEPVSVSAGERAYHEHRLTTSMRRTDPNWRWSGPSIPATKAPFSSLRADSDGRIWVLVAAPGEVIPEAERPEPRAGEPPGPEPWQQPQVYDVFDRDGRFLGTVRPPRRFTFHGARGDEVWGVLRDELDVPYVVILRLAEQSG
jgi:hypothetical protein